MSFLNVFFPCTSKLNAHSFEYQIPNLLLPCIYLLSCYLAVLCCVRANKNNINNDGTEKNPIKMIKCCNGSVLKYNVYVFTMHQGTLIGDFIMLHHDYNNFKICGTSFYWHQLFFLLLHFQVKQERCLNLSWAKAYKVCMNEWASKSKTTSILNIPSIAAKMGKPLIKYSSIRNCFYSKNIKLFFFNFANR